MAKLKMPEKQLKITLDGEWFEKRRHEECRMASIIPKYACMTELFNFIRTPHSIDCPELKTIKTFSWEQTDENIVTSETCNGNIKIVCGKDALAARKEYLLGMIKEKGEEPYPSSNTINNLLAHSALQRDVFITENPSAKRNKHIFNKELKTSVMSIREATTYLDLFAKKNGMFLSAPRFTESKFYWYRNVFREMVPSYRNCFCSIKPNLTGIILEDNKTKEFLESILHRSTFLLYLKDLLGQEYYWSDFSDSFDANLFHLGYLAVLATGIFDSLAWLAFYIHELSFDHINEKQKIGLRKAQENFVEELFKKNEPLSKLIKENVNFIELFYPLRDTIAHRTLPQVIALLTSKDQAFTEAYGMIGVDSEFWNSLSVVDIYKNDWGNHVSDWGRYKAPIKMPGLEVRLLEPFTFSCRSLNEIILLTERFLGLLFPFLQKGNAHNKKDVGKIKTRIARFDYSKCLCCFLCSNCINSAH